MMQTHILTIILECGTKVTIESTFNDDAYEFFNLYGTYLSINTDKEEFFNISADGEELFIESDKNGTWSIHSEEDAIYGYQSSKEANGRLKEYINEYKLTLKVDDKEVRELKFNKKKVIFASLTEL
jgi:hypothetical protein